MKSIEFFLGVLLFQHNLLFPKCIVWSLCGRACRVVYVEPVGAERALISRIALHIPCLPKVLIICSQQFL